MQEKFEQLKSKAFSFAFKMKKGPKLQNWKEEKQKKERSTQMGQQKKKKKETNKQKIKHIKWINEKHKHEKNFHFVIMKSTYVI